MSGNMLMEQRVREEQYKDMIRSAERYRLARGYRPRPRRLRQLAIALRETVSGLRANLAGPRPAKHAQI
jgi:hypothetical protein